jgi:hypothetical protein
VTLILPNWDFDALRGRLDALGFLLVSEGELPPLRPGEPELASFSWRQGDADLVYTYNPALETRELEVHGGDAETARRRIVRAIPCEIPETPLQSLVRAALVERLQERFSVWDGLDAPSRRQVLRWFMADALDTPHVRKVLHEALVDPDWEVRVSALLAVGRLDLHELGLAVRRCVLPGSESGLDGDHRSLLRAAQKATLEHFNGLPIPTDPKLAPWAQVREAVAGIGAGPLADALAPLTEPLQHPAGEPLRVRGIEMVQVPSVPHRIGRIDLSRGVGLDWWTPQPFRIAVHPLTRRQCGLLSRPDEAWRGTRTEASAILQELGGRFRVPLFAEWECALRGPDGRRFPWGMGRGRGPSPWGLHTGEGPELVGQGAAELGWRLLDQEEGALRPIG